MKPRFINTPNGVILTSAIHGILYDTTTPEKIGIVGEGEEVAPPNAVLLLSGGVHLPTGRPFDEVQAEMIEALEASPFTGMIPEIADAMAQLRNHLQANEDSNESGAADETGKGKRAVAKTGKDN